MRAKSSTTTWTRWTVCGLALAALGACGGDGEGDKNRHLLGGTVNGLAGTVVLHTNTGDRVRVSHDGAFTFPSRILRGTNYRVAVLTQPPSQFCSVSNGTGRMQDNDVVDVRVVCGEDFNHSLAGIGGTINGLTGAVTLSWYVYADAQTFTENGQFSFAELSALGNSYDVVVVQQPDGQTCSVANGFGAIYDSVMDVIVSCVDSSAVFAVGGAISGLTGAGLRIEAGPGNFVEPVPGAAGFTLPTRLGNAVAYDVGVAAQPEGQTCLVTNASGRIDAADVEDIRVHCFERTTDPLSGTFVAPGLPAGNYVTLFPDGLYLVASIEDDSYCGRTALGNGVEYGVYHYDAAAHSFSMDPPLVDTNGRCGVWNDVGRFSIYDGMLAVAGSGTTTELTFTPRENGMPIQLVPVASTPAEIVGSWAAPYQKNVAVFLPAADGQVYYLMTETQADPPPLQTGAVAGIEYGCATVDTMSSGRLDVDYSNACDAPTPVSAGLRDTNGRSGLRPDYSAVSFNVSGDSMTMNGVEYRRVRVP